MKAYITRYWETRGIIEAEGEISEHGHFRSKNPELWTAFSKKDFHTHLTDAWKDVEARRKKKINSLYKKITKLEKMTF